MNCCLPKVLKNSTLFENKRSKDHGGPDPKRPKSVESTRVASTEIVVETWKLSRDEEANFKSVLNYSTLLKRPDYSS